MPAKQKRSKRKAVQTPPQQRLKVLAGALFVLGFLIVSLVLLAQLRETLRPASSPSAPTAPAAPTVPGRDALVDDVRVELESALLRSGVSLEQLRAGLESGRIHFEVRGAFPPTAVVAELERRLRRVSPELRLDIRPAAGELSLYRDELLLARLCFRRPAPALPEGDGPKVAIIVDDLGADLAAARALLAIDLPVTFSVLPGTAAASRVATMAHRRGREVLIHIPMEPLSYPETDPGRDALMVAHDAEEIRRRFRGYVERIPYAVGGNNHMGSRFTENREGMQAVLGAMREAELFFVDSLTSGRSVAFDEARRAGLPAAARDVFLDNVAEEEAITRQLRQLAAVAVRQGTAIGIGHPYPQTLEALRQARPYLAEQGIEVVPVSRLLVR